VARRVFQNEGDRAIGLAHQTGGHERDLRGRLVIHGQRDNLRDRPLTIAHDDLPASPDLFQLLREPVSEIGNVCASHNVLNMAMIAMLRHYRALVCNRPFKRDQETFLD
jgi:hypothetical protein